MSKVVSKIVFIGVAASLLIGAGFALRQNSAPAALAKAKGEGQAVAYQPSRYPGVQVRHVPNSQTASAASGAGQEAWIGKRPGTARPREGIVMPSVAARAPGQGLRTGQGTTKFGGTWVAVPPDRVPLSVGRRDAQRKAVVACVEPHDHSKH